MKQSKKTNFNRKQRRNPIALGNIVDQHENHFKQLEQAVIRNIKSLNQLNTDFTNLLRYSPAESAQEGDFLVIDYLGRLLNEDGSLGDGFQGNTGKGMSIRNLGNGELVPGFEDALVGKQPGDSLEIVLTFPEDYHAHLANKKVKFFVAVLEVLREPANGSYVDKELELLAKYNADKKAAHEASMKKAMEEAGVSEEESSEAEQA